MNGGKGFAIGVRREDKKQNTPGPGAYSNSDVIGMVKSKGASVRIGNTKRPDNFTKKEVQALPGPGNYIETANTFGKGVKGAANMGSKYRPEKNTNPGPGQYQSESNKATQAKSTVKIGTTKRPDIWAKDAKGENPGPGNYIETANTFGKGVKGAATMGSKHRQERNTNPGPGQYSYAEKNIRPTSSYGKIGTNKREDLWGS